VGPIKKKGPKSLSKGGRVDEESPYTVQIPHGSFEGERQIYTQTREVRKGDTTQGGTIKKKVQKD